MTPIEYVQDLNAKSCKLADVFDESTLCDILYKKNRFFRLPKLAQVLCNESTGGNNQHSIQSAITSCNANRHGEKTGLWQSSRDIQAFCWVQLEQTVGKRRWNRIFVFPNLFFPIKRIAKTVQVRPSHSGGQTDLLFNRDTHRLFHLRSHPQMSTAAKILMICETTPRDVPCSHLMRSPPGSICANKVYKGDFRSQQQERITLNFGTEIIGVLGTS